MSKVVKAKAYDCCGFGVSLLDNDELDRAWRDVAYETGFKQ